MLRNGFLLIALMSFCIAKVFGQNSDLPNHVILEAEIDSIVLAGMAANAYPGAQVFVSKDGHTIINKSYGYHRYDKMSTVENNHVYDLASITKVTTGLPILMQLYSANEFDLDAPLKKYIPKFKNSDKGNLILRDILTHQAKLEPYIIYWQKALRGNRKSAPTEVRYKNRTFKNKRSKRFSIEITKELFLHRKYKKKIYKYIDQSPLNIAKGYKYSGLCLNLKYGYRINSKICNHGKRSEQKERYKIERKKKV